MNEQNITTHRKNTSNRRRFCDNFGIYGLMCLGFFAAFVALIKHAGRFS